MFFIFSSLSTKVTVSNWSGWLRRVQHAEGRKKQKQESFCYDRAEEKRKEQARPFGQ